MRLRHSVLDNKLGDGADALVAAAREMPQLVTLCGIQCAQADVDFSRRISMPKADAGGGRRLLEAELDAGDAKLLVFDLSKNQAIKKLK